MCIRDRVLSALHGQMIDIHQACAIAIGSNVGTTITLVLATIKGPADKKRIAFFHVFFNLVSVILAFLAMKIILDLIVNKFFITDPIFVVSMFNTVVNVGGVILFFPFIGYISQKLQSSYEEKDHKGQCNFINKVSTEVTDVALTALDNEIKNVFNLTKAFVFSVLLSKETEDTLIHPIDKILLKKEDPMDKYQLLKITEDEIASFYKRLQSKDLTYCLLYTSDAADERSSVDLGGRRIIKKKTNTQIGENRTILDKTEDTYDTQ